MKKWITLMLLFFTGICIGWMVKSRDTEIIIKEADLTKELHAIDSLSSVINERELLIDSLRQNVKVVRETMIVKVKEVQKLDITPSVELLKENLVTYGELTTPEDSLPTAILPDSTILLSQNNVKDVNSIVEKYKGELEVNKTLEEIIKKDSSIIEDQSTQLVLKDSIQFKKDFVYTENLTALKLQNKKEKKKTRTVIIISSIVSAILLGLNFAR